MFFEVTLHAIAYLGREGDGIELTLTDSVFELPYLHAIICDNSNLQLTCTSTQFKGVNSRVEKAREMELGGRDRERESAIGIE